MKSPVALVSVASVALLIACGSSAEPPPSSTAATSPPPSSVAPPASVAPPPPSSAPTALSADQRAAFTTAFREGRRLAGTSAWADAAAQFEAAVAIMPANVHVRCEAGLAELRAGNTSAAAANMQIVQRTLSVAPRNADRERTAMCLYNVGLVAEASGAPDAARDAYTRSIALRPNATVSAHLAALAAPTAPPLPREGGWIVFPDGTSDEALLSALRDQFCSGWVGCPSAAAIGHGTSASATPASELISARVDWLGVSADDGVVYLVVRAGAMVRATPLAGSHGQAPGITELTLVDAIPGGAPEVHLLLAMSDTTDGYAPCDVDEDTQIYCTTDGGLRCAGFDVRYDSSCWTRDDAIGDDTDLAADSEQAADDATMSHHATAVLEGATLTITNGTGTDAFESDWPAFSLVGAHPLQALFDQTSASWPSQ